MRLFLLFTLTWPSWAAVNNLQIATSPTSTQIAVTFTITSPGSACTIEISKESDFTPLEIDVDPAAYTDANLCGRAGSVVNGNSYIVTFGKQGAEAIEQNLAGYTRSRALTADTQYYIRVTNGSSAATSVRTANIPLGDSRGQGLAVHDIELWRYKQTTTNKLANPEFADPYTGAQIKNPPALVGYGYSQSTATSGDGYSPVGCNVTLTGVKGSCKFTDATGANWSATTGTLTDTLSADDDNFAVYSGTTQDKLFVRLGTTGKYPLNSTLGPTSNGQNLSFQNIHFSAKTSDASGEGGWTRWCITGDGLNCHSPARRVTLTATEAVYSVCGDDPCTKDNPGDVMYDRLPGTIPGPAKVYNESGSLGTLKFAGTNATAACNDIQIGENIVAYDSRTNGNGAYAFPVTAKSCGSAPPEVTSSATTLDITHNGTTGVTYFLNRGLAGPKYGILVWKESTTSGSTISIDLPLWRAATYPPYFLAFGSGGFGKRYQNVPTADGYYLGMTGADQNIIVGIKKLADGTVDVKNYGIASWRGDLINAGLANSTPIAQSAAGNDAPWDDELPGVFYMKFTSAAGCGDVIVKMTLNLAAPAAADPDGTFPLGTRIRSAGLSSNLILTPCGSGDSDFSPSAQRTRFSSEWVAKGSMFGNCAIEGVQALTLFEICRAGQQDSHGFIFAYDLGNRLAPGAGFVGTRGGNTQQVFAGFLTGANPATRFCGVHTYQNPMTQAGAPFAMIEMGTKNPHTVVINTALSACDSRNSPGTCGACPDVTVDGFNYNGKNWCASITINSSCASVGAPAGCTDGDPVSSGGSDSPNLKWYQPLAVGDVLRRNVGEHLKLLVRNSQTSWVALRGWGYQSSEPSADQYAPETVSSGGTWATWCGAHSKDPLVTRPEDPWGLAWYFGDDTLGTNSLYTFLNRWQNHGWQITDYGCFPDYKCGKFDFASPSSNKASITGGSNVGLPTTFAGKATFCNGNACEKHPGAAQLLGDTSWFSDVNPRMFHPAGTNAVALASGKTYIYQYNGAAVISPKHYDLVAYMGSYPMRRVDTLTDSAADTGKWAVSIVNNDVFSGAVAGKMYFVNEVFDTTFIPLATCRESQFGVINGDACMGPESGMSAAITQWKVPTSNGITIGNGGQMRAVSREWRRYREDVTENVKADPTGSTLLTRFQWYVVPPPFPGVDSRNRATFTALPIEIGGVPPGTNNVLVQFGRNPSFQCSRNRDNTCYSESATLVEATPFKFDHESLSGLSCAAGCTPIVPLVANEMTYYRLVYRDAGGNVIHRGATQVAAVQ